MLERNIITATAFAVSSDGKTYDVFFDYFKNIATVRYDSRTLWAGTLDEYDEYQGNASDFALSKIRALRITLDDE